MSLGDAQGQQLQARGPCHTSHHSMSRKGGETWGTPRTMQRERVQNWAIRH